MDAAAGQELFTVKGHTAEVNSVAFSTDGKRLASASKGTSPPPVRIAAKDWVPPNKQIGRVINEAPMPKVTIDNDGNAVVGGDSELKVRGALLVVRIKVNKSGELEERFLAYPINDGDPKGVRVVTEPGLGCQWTRTSHWSEGGARISRLNLKENFSVSNGPSTGQVLCVGEQNSLVLRDGPIFPVVREVENDNLYDGK